MVRRIITCCCWVGSVLAQDVPEWGALLGASPEASPPGIVEVLADARPWATRIASGLSRAERAAVLRDGPRSKDVVTAVAMSAALDRAGERLQDLSAQALYERAFACSQLVGLAAQRDVQSKALGRAEPGPAAAQQRAAIAHGAAALASLCRRYPADAYTARAFLEFAPTLFAERDVDDDVRLDLIVAAVRVLGDDAGVGAWLQVASARLRARDVVGARAAVARARVAPMPFSLELCESRFDELADIEQWVRAVEIEAAAARGTSPLDALEQAVLYRTGDIAARARAALQAGVVHALPEAALAWEDLMAGRRSEAAARIERAAKLPGVGLRVTVMRMLIALPELQRRRAESPDDPQLHLEMDIMLSEMDDAVGEVGGAVATGARVLLDSAAGGEDAARSALRDFASVLAETKRAPQTRDEFVLGLIGAAGACLDAEATESELALRFLELPVDAALARRPILMRKLASVATVVAAQAAIYEASDAFQQRARDVAEQARARSRELGDVDWADYLELTERWVAARSVEDQRAVLEDLGAITASRVQDGAWLPGSAALVLGLGAGDSFDQQAFLSLRAVSGAAAPSAMVPLAAVLLVHNQAAAQSLVGSLRQALPPGVERNILAVAEIEGGAPPAVAAARARSVLGSQDWSDAKAKSLARGLQVAGEVGFGFNMVGMRPELRCSFECTPVMLPKLKRATELKSLARRR